VIECLLNASDVEWEGEPAVMGVFEDVTQRKQLEAELRSLATTDSLTDLANRRYFLARQKEALSRQKRGIDHKIAVLMLDLDHFKDINDAFGHLGGDEVLRSFSNVLRNELRQIDIAGRMGGEEFAVMLPETDMLAAAVFAERLRQKVAGTSVILDQQRVSITVSIGIALMSPHDIRPDQVLQRADEALYRAKTLGRNRIELAEAPESPENILTPELADDKFPNWSEDSDPYALGNVYQTRRFRFDNRQNRPS
jgi:diguanylate cyclase (GGDEF)-like protein